MYRQPTPSRSITIIRLFLCVIFLIHSSMAMAAPSRTSPQITRSVESNGNPNATLLGATTISNQPVSTTSACPVAYCTYLPYMAASGSDSPPVTIEPDTQPTPTPSEPEVQPTPVPPAPDTQ